MRDKNIVCTHKTRVYFNMSGISVQTKSNVMNSTPCETEKTDTRKCWPLEVNVNVWNSKGSNRNVLRDVDTQEERMYDTQSKDSDATNGVPKRHRNSTNKPPDDEIVRIDIDDEILPCEDKSKSSDNSHTKNRHKHQKGSAMNKFLIDLYERKLDLHNKFSDQELEDIRSAVTEKVNQIANTLHEIDSRLKIREVILAGSAREGTQIIRPSEFDYILVLDLLSRPGAVTIMPADPKGDSREYMHVKLNDNDAKSVLHEFSDNDCIIASRVFPCSRQGLRDLFFSAVQQVIELCSKSRVRRTTGVLKIHRSKPEINGPATTIGLQWGSATPQRQTTMDISVDLCPALKLGAEEYLRLLPLADEPVALSNSNSNRNSESLLQSCDNLISNDCGNSSVSDIHLKSYGSEISNESQRAVSNDVESPLSSQEAPRHCANDIADIASKCPQHDNEESNVLDYATSIKSVLLMPRDGMRFKVTFTETELKLTSGLSDHHRKCYMFLKYFVNGEPYPPEKLKIVHKIYKYIDLFQISHHIRHSYLLKQIVWDHHYIKGCHEEKDFDKCVTTTFHDALSFMANPVIGHPLNRSRRIVYDNENILDKTSILDLNFLLKYYFTFRVKHMQNTPHSEYDYKTFVRFFTVRQYLVFVKLLLLLLLYLFLVFCVIVSFWGFYHGEVVVGLNHILILCIMLYIYIPGRWIQNKWTPVANRLSLCTKHVNLWLFCALMFLLLVASVVDSKWNIRILIIIFFIIIIITRNIFRPLEEILPIEPRRKKSEHRVLRPGLTQTATCNHRKD